MFVVGGDPAGPGVEGGDRDGEGNVLVVVPIVELLCRDCSTCFGIDEE